MTRDERIAMMKERFARIEKDKKGFDAAFGEIPIAKEDIIETAKEDLDAFQESQRDIHTAREALTSDEM